MKYRISLAFLKRKNLQKKQACVFKEDLPAATNTNGQAKIIDLYRKEFPVRKQAKVISIFN
jgi:hypothetical protein